MLKENYTLLLGASGNLGGKVAHEFITRGIPVGLVARDTSRLRAFEGSANLLEGDFHDDGFLRDSLSRATGLFCTVPDTALAAPEASAARLIKLLQDSPVSHVVNISNATLKRGGNYTSLIRFEQELSKVSGIAVKHLRCANFFENLNWGINTPYLPHVKLPYISSYEIAHVAAVYLQHRSFEGVTVDELLGERDYSMAELAERVGVPYSQLPYSQENIHFYRPFNEGEYELVPRTEQNTTVPANPRFTLDYFIRHELRLV
ncbi:NAD(P)H-binding protein [Pontibacter roseus]|uniref:NAD(P)H-binding protein n=1 Tax=Pontibacter roseus TaxID=336989 RepID=UPI000370A1A0|nr:NAD(P)H-binding protein [Pontibacter roseus]